METPARKNRSPFLSGSGFLCKLVEHCCIRCRGNVPCSEASALLLERLCGGMECGAVLAVSLRGPKSIGVITCEAVTIVVADSRLREKDLLTLQDYCVRLQSGGRASLIAVTDFEDDPFEASWANRLFRRIDLVEVLELANGGCIPAELESQARYYCALEKAVSAWQDSPMEHWGTCAWNGFFRHCAQSSFLETARSEGLFAARGPVGNGCYLGTQYLYMVVASQVAESMPEGISETTSEITLAIGKGEIVISLLPKKELYKGFDEEQIANDASVVRRYFRKVLGKGALFLDCQSRDGFVRDVVGVAYDADGWGKIILDVIDAAQAFKRQKKENR
ncbi:hypothetical protein QUW41_09905 [Slackia piriformis]|nr:hypothetical protein [Slackia piriformis]